MSECGKFNETSLIEKDVFYSHLNHMPKHGRDYWCRLHAHKESFWRF